MCCCCCCYVAVYRLCFAGGCSRFVFQHDFRFLNSDLKLESSGITRLPQRRPVSRTSTQEPVIKWENSNPLFSSLFFAAENLKTVDDLICFVIGWFRNLFDMMMFPILLSKIGKQASPHSIAQLCNVRETPRSASNRCTTTGLSRRCSLGKVFTWGWNRDNYSNSGSDVLLSSIQTSHRDSPKSSQLSLGWWNLRVILKRKDGELMVTGSWGSLF